MPKPDPDSTAQKIQRAVFQDIERLLRVILLLLVLGYVVDLFMAMEVFDVYDVDIEPGSNASILSAEGLGSILHQVGTITTLLTAVIVGMRHLWKSAKGE